MKTMLRATCAVLLLVAVVFAAVGCKKDDPSPSLTVAMATAPQNTETPSGWISPPPTPQPPSGGMGLGVVYVKVDSTGVNLRAEPSADAPQCGFLLPNAKVEILEVDTASGWCKVQAIFGYLSGQFDYEESSFYNNSQGYCRAEYLTSLEGIPFAQIPLAKDEDGVAFERASSELAPVTIDGKQRYVGMTMLPWESQMRMGSSQACYLLDENQKILSYIDATLLDAMYVYSPKVIGARMVDCNSDGVEDLVLIWRELDEGYGARCAVTVSLARTLAGGRVEYLDGVRQYSSDTMTVPFYEQNPAQDATLFDDIMCRIKACIAAGYESGYINMTPEQDRG